jgi:ATP-dependent Clp protease ATP-binding subunit ClpB
MSKRLLDPVKLSDSSASLMRSFGRRIIGQEEAVTTLADMVEHSQSGFCDKTRPAGSCLFLGPTGSGKTRVVEALAHGLFYNEKAMVKIDCAEFQHSHEIAKLVGSPPGYLGHRETPPLLTTERINQYKTPTLNLGIVLFDEIEKASDALWQLLLGVLDKATLTLGTNAEVSFSNQLIIMTSNLGSQDMAKMVDGGLGFGYNKGAQEENWSRLEKSAIEAAKKKFTAEFYNRIDRVVVFRRLSKDQIKDILKIELGMVQQRLQACEIPFLIHVSDPVKQVLLDEGYSPKYGARELRRVVRQRIQTPLARMVSTKQINNNDIVFIDKGLNGEFEFSIEARVPDRSPTTLFDPPAYLPDKDILS